MLVQKINQKFKEDFKIAERYFSIISTINDLGMTEREIQLVAYTALHGNISYKHLKEEFCSLYNSSIPTINNMISKLKKVKVLVKMDGKIKINPLLSLNFKKDVSLVITLLHDSQ